MSDAPAQVETVVIPADPPKTGDHLHDQQTLGISRLVAGALQGLILYLLYRADDAKVWPATDPYWMAPLLMMSVFVPVLFMQAAGTMRRLTLVIWTAGAAALLAGLAWYDIWRQWDPSQIGGDGAMTFALIAFSMVGFFIAQSLVSAADAERKYIASYTAYFDAAWKFGVQLALAVAFVGVFWGVLWLGAELFKLIGLNFIETLIEKSWFAIPATTLAIAASIHVTDVRAKLVAGIRTVVLTLLSWLLPLMALIAVGFVLSLPFTGLAALWATRSAASILLTSAAVLVILINAAFQDGDPAHNRPVALRYAELVAALILIPIVIVAAHALWLRVAQYGWTVERIATAAAILIALFYTFGYAAAALLSLRGGTWMHLVSWVNIVTAFAVLAVLLAMFTPLGDPARLSVNAQVARLKSGKVKAEAFDFAYLRSEGGHYGRSALTAIAAADFGKDTTAIRTLAKQALNGFATTPSTQQRPNLAQNITIYPAGSSLPAGFATQDWTRTAGTVPSCLTLNFKCDAFFADIDGDGKDEVLLADGGDSYLSATVMARGADGKWSAIASFSGSCPGLVADLRAGKLQVVAPERALHDVMIGPARLHPAALFNTFSDCGTH